jgi:DnaJ-class molecular chaperone
MKIPKTDFFTVRCTVCGGAGYQADQEHCTVCQGHGLILLPGDVAEYNDCAGCAGSGFVGTDGSKICLRCGGVGALRIQTLSGGRPLA